jgi:hypothetical protein
MENFGNDNPMPAAGGQVEMQATNTSVATTAAQNNSQSMPQRSGGLVLDTQDRDIESNIQAGLAKPPVVHKPLNESVHDFKLKPTEAVRTEVLKALEARKRRLDRQAALNMPEIHFVGQISSGINIISDASEGAFCR